MNDNKKLKTRVTEAGCGVGGKLETLVLEHGTPETQS